MNKAIGYTHAITYLKKVDGHGWMYNDFRTTEDALKLHLKSLANQEARGVVRLVTLSKLR